MVKKISEPKSSASGKSSPASGSPVSALASSVKESAQQIWLAGMGAFSKAQEEGSKVFEALVKEGQTLQKKTQGVAEERLSEVTHKLSAMADTVAAKTGQNWDKLEAIFEQRTAKALGKLGVPTAQDLAALSARLDALAAAVDRLAEAKSAPAKTPARRARKTPAKAAAKTAAVAKAVPQAK